MPPGDRCSRARARCLGRALLLRARRRSRGRGRAGCRGTPGATTTRSCASGSTRSGGGSAARTACSSTRTSTSTARRGARGRRLLRQEHDADHARRTAPGSCSARSSPTSRSSRRPPLDARLRQLHALHRRVPDGRARRARRARRDPLPLVLDAGARRRCPAT